MNPPPPSVVGGASAAERLAQSRTAIAGWLEQEARQRTTPSAMGWAVHGILPLLQGLHENRGIAVVLGTLVQAWLRPGASRPVPNPITLPPPGTRPLASRHPKTALLIAGVAGLALLWWSRTAHRRPPL